MNIGCSILGFRVRAVKEKPISALSSRVWPHTRESTRYFVCVYIYIYISIDLFTTLNPASHEHVPSRAHSAVAWLGHKDTLYVP